jgi:type IV pilus assembly protein PilA
VHLIKLLASFEDIQTDRKLHKGEKMKLLKAVRNQKGFSLVELMIVVAIIGILSAVAIPNFARFQRKARQSEVKMNLSSYFTSEQAFAAEFNMYAGNFAATGFKPLGNLNYRLISATSASATVTTAPGYIATCDTTATAPGTCLSQYVEMGAGSATAIGVDTVIAAPAAAAVTTFTGVAGGWIGGAASDTWSINQAKTLANTASGIN